MIIIRLQLAVYNSGNVQVKRMEYFSRLGGYKRFVNHKTYRKTFLSYNKMGRKIPFFVKGGALKNNTDTSHGISVFSHGENPTEFFCIVCLIPKIFNGKNRATRSFAEMKKIFFLTFFKFFYRPRARWGSRR
jgi:hypothetical protein